jgi:group I intron endonuclease
MSTTIDNIGVPTDYKKSPAIYIFRNNINDKFYIGETLNLKQRMYSYCRLKKENRPIIKAIRKYGIENFSFEYYFFPNFTKDDLIKLEEEMIKKYKSSVFENGYNIWIKGQNRRGATHSEESRKRRSEIFKGRIITKEWRENISKSKRGEKHPMYGKKLSEETKKKMGDSRRGERNGRYGKKTSNEHKNKLMMNRKDRIEVEQYTKCGEFIGRYPSIREAARQTGIDSRYINPVCDKIGRSAKGYIWKKVIPND